MSGLPTVLIAYDEDCAEDYAGVGFHMIEGELPFGIALFFIPNRGSYQSVWPGDKCTVCGELAEGGYMSAATRTDSDCSGCAEPRCFACAGLPR